jgi:hypothetical protein
MSRITVAERKRVAEILANDRQEALRESRRQDAAFAMEMGDYTALDDARIAPTPERLAKGDFVEVNAGKEHWTHKTTTTMRDMNKSRIVKLHRTGLLNDDTFAACVWYREKWESGGLDPSPPVAGFEPFVRGEPNYGHLPRTLNGVEARKDFRYVRSKISPDIVGLMELVVLHEVTIVMAARLARCRFKNATAAFQRGVLELQDAVSPMLPVRQIYHDGT